MLVTSPLWHFMVELLKKNSRHYEIIKCFKHIENRIIVRNTLLNTTHINKCYYFANCVSGVFLLEIFIIWLERWHCRDKKGVVERERKRRDIFHLRAHSPDGLMPGAGLVQSQKPGTVSVFRAGSRGPRTWAMLHYFPRCISRKLGLRTLPIWDTSITSSSSSLCSTTPAPQRFFFFPKEFVY